MPSMNVPDPPATAREQQVPPPRKNWAAIAEIGNEQLRKLAISAKGEVARKLAIGWPELFLAEGSPAEQMNIDVMLDLIAECRDQRDSVLEVVKGLAVPVKGINFVGVFSGRCDGISYADPGTTQRGRKGEGVYFHRTNRNQGSEFELDDATWVVVWNGYHPESPDGFARHSLIMVPKEAFSGW